MEKIIISRLLKYVDPFSNLDISSGLSTMGSKIDCIFYNISSHYLTIEDSYIDNAYRGSHFHYPRIKHFMELLCQDHSLEPISIDQRAHFHSLSCISWGHPIITDGNHRLIANILMNKKYINAEASGTMMMIDYLTGKISRRDFEKNLS